MESTYNNSKKILNTDHGRQNDYEIIVFGTNNLSEQLKDTLALALCRYMAETGIGTNKLSKLTGISKGTISRYCHGTSGCNYDYLYAICIALKLRNCRQSHLFALIEHTPPDGSRDHKIRSYIIRDYLDGCSFDDKFSVVGCNRSLVEAGESPLTPLPFQEDV